MSKPEIKSEENKNQSENEPEMVTVTVELYKPFYDFLKDYLAFFGSKQTMGDLYQQIIYEEARHLYSDLAEFAKESMHFVGKRNWTLKYLPIAQTINEVPGCDQSVEECEKSKALDNIASTEEIPELTEHSEQSKMLHKLAEETRKALKETEKAKNKTKVK